MSYSMIGIECSLDVDVWWDLRVGEVQELEQDEDDSWIEGSGDDYNSGGLDCLST